ncbi:IPT/TIG domain-containing protein [Flavitalea sp. BT771]|uniref:IPT/TIG domain-containing protein n=1 Tax=Flavitalea sp. BT771 TaxID=3063329 RepID=UPI0026E11D01|nr:IPT/TIG domain-containing protein [Flavitalea sp. BT771]MDO6430037.1 IPT/TIG domain-containing protein [Flavitalea sp. BT771]MDV6219824.1 IPT/TIG domain-containing protein [Flavitalea sp. BT771]
MKTPLLLLQWPLVLILLLSTGCKKNDPPVTPKPTITAITPVSGSAGATVTITGTDFGATAADNTVKFNGTVANITSATASSLVVAAPAAGTTGPVTVTTKGGTASGPVFTYVVIPPPPTITSISPVSGSAGTTVTINGTHFKTTAMDNTVKFNGTAATVQTATATALTVLAPASGTTGAVTVTTSDGTATGPVFTYVPVPDVYVVGTSIYGHSYWKNGVRTDLPSECVAVRGIFVAGTDVYVAGADNNNAPKYWKNGVGVSLPMTTGNNGGIASSIFVSGTDVYVAGWDMNNGSYAVPKCWKNGVALPMTFSVLGAAHSVWVDGSDVYVAGSEGPATGNSIATVWKNGSPTTLTDGTTVAEATGVTVAGGAVYVSGYIQGAVQRVYWKNNIAVPLATPGSYDCSQWGIYVSTAGDVYVSGVYRNLAKYWKNGVMVDLTTTTPGNGIYESAMAITGSGSDVYIAGNAISLGAGYWKNGVFTSLPGADQVNGIFVK